MCSVVSVCGLSLQVNVALVVGVARYHIAPQLGGNPRVPHNVESTCSIEGYDVSTSSPMECLVSFIIASRNKSEADLFNLKLNCHMLSIFCCYR